MSTMEETIFPMDYHEHLVNLYKNYSMGTGTLDHSASIGVQLTKLEEFFKKRNVNVSSQCTANSETTCWISNNLTPWNEILNDIGCELIEDSPDHLTLHSLSYSETYHHAVLDQEVILAACILFHWLLKHHECIGAVNVCRHEMTLNHALLYYDALSENKTAKSLVVYSCCVGKHYMSQLALTCGTMPQLERLELRDMTEDYRIICTIGGKNVTRPVWSEETFWEEFLEKLQHCTNLKYLKLDINDISSPSVTHFATILQNNRKLEHLYIGGFELWSTELQQIAESLSAKPLLNLQKLELTCQFDESELHDFKDALKKQPALTSVKFSDCDVDVQDIVGCIEGIVNLQELRLYCDPIDDDGALSVANYIRSNHFLKAVHLKYNRLSKHQMATLFAALANNSHTLLYLGSISFDSTDAWDLPAMDEMCNVSGQVQLYYDGTISPKLLAPLNTNKYFFKKVTINWRLNSTSEEFEELFVALQSNRTVTKLSVEPEPVTDKFMCDLGDLLRVNQTLQCLNLVTSLQASHLKVLFDALTENSALSQLTLGSCSFDPCAYSALINMLKMNKALSFLSCLRGSEEKDEEISTALLENYTLRVLQLGSASTGHVAFRYKEVQRRNQATFNSALQYALKNLIERNPAVSFERLRHCGNFVLHLAKFAGISKDEAKECVCSTKRYITSNYLLITGVVKEKLQCTRSGHGGVQFDALNVDCLEQIFLYLKVTDVLV